MIRRRPLLSGNSGRRIAAGALLLTAVAPAASPAQPAAASRDKAEPCLACHGPDGNSQMPEIPSLAGQPQQSLASALFQFREGDRKDALMTPLAADLANADMNALAAYFAQQHLAPPPHSADEAASAAARPLIERNRCAQCHGPALEGQQQIPRLAGQQRDYLVRQLRAFRDGTRRDLDGQMGQAAQPLADADIDRLADYLSGLGAP